MTRGRFFALLAAALTALALLGCGGGTSLDLTGGQPAHKAPNFNNISAWDITPELTLNTGDELDVIELGSNEPLFQGNTAANPQPRIHDLIDISELPDFTEFEIDLESRTPSAVETIDLATYAGSSGDVLFNAGTLAIISSPGAMAWAHYALPLPQTDDFTGFAVTGTLSRAPSGSTGLWVALSNYSRNSWTFQGPFDLENQVIIEDIDPARYGGDDDLMHIILLTFNGDQADMTDLKRTTESIASEVPPAEFATAILDAGINYAALSLRENHGALYYDAERTYATWAWWLWSFDGGTTPFEDLFTKLPSYWSAWSGSEDPGFFRPDEYPEYMDGKRELMETAGGLQDVILAGIAEMPADKQSTVQDWNPVLQPTDSLANAIADLVTATGETPALGTYQAALGALDAADQDALARVITAIEDAYTTHDDTLTNLFGAGSGWEALDRDYVFHSFHGNWVQNIYTASTWPIDNSGYSFLVRGFPYHTAFFEGSCKIADAIDDLNEYIDTNTPVWEDVNLEVETPAGLIVISGINDDNHTERKPAIVGKDDGTNTYSVPGDFVSAFTVGSTFVVYGASSDNGLKTVTATAINGPNTDITVAETLSDATADGEIHLNGHLVLIDLGGNDTYTCAAGGTATSANSVSVCLDIAGDDTYSSLDDPLDGNRGTSNDDNYSQYGAARLGIGILADFTGMDTYTSSRMSQGFAMYGVGVLADFGMDDDVYTAEGFSQGCAIGGLGLLYDEGSATGSQYSIWGEGQGYGNVMGIGMLVQHGDGDDTYYAEPTFNAARPEYTDGADVNNNSFAQGCAAGLAIDTTNRLNPVSGNPYAAAGGYGLLFDSAGNDTYTCGIAGQGFGYFQGHGLLIDNAGDDMHNSVSYAQGAALKYGLGGLWDQAGNDNYFNTNLVGVGGAEDGSVSWFYEASGNDIYDSAQVSLGFGYRHAYSFFIESVGNDNYGASFMSDHTIEGLGRGGFIGGTFFNADTDPAIGIFVDARGADYYNPGFDGMLLGTDDSTIVDTPPDNGAQWIRTGGTYTDGGFYPAGKGSGIDGQ